MIHDKTLFVIIGLIYMVFLCVPCPTKKINNAKIRETRFVVTIYRILIRKGY